ncbi:hypothetical protein JCM10021v2_000552 [Rhodotorula toruloides]|uniref:BY PROTMAP: gi/472588117/gb/EMS25589.1/ monooxygenase [Rhodosporidium toruloides NP11] gi/647403605/emb/CDR49703.1/ RHTO0S30e00606g1_1 [Rhodosporidium toruloides] n=1 Tax=Rhodotorula toruloides TaxID=5286 RepID=A0A0K3CMB7_RHOTO|nr:hypothetical protein AAT19DRAFT_15705 [Rhodotorula toruloides]
MVQHGPYAGFETGMDAVAAQRKTGISAIVVGAGIAGLACAVELKLNGHSPVTVYDSVPKFARLGDTIGVMPNAGRILGRWPKLFDTLDPLCGHSRGLSILRYDGRWIVDQKPPPLVPRDQETDEDRQRREAEEKYTRENPMFDAHRGDLHQTLLDYAKSVGVEVKQGIAVTAYEETDTGASVLIDGIPHTADVVIAADGVKSKAREIVLGYVDKPKSSGYAIYRAFFDGDRIRENPACAHLVADGVDQRNCWIGPDVHFIAAGVKGTKEFSWVLTHLDQADVEESWVARGKVEDAIKVVEDWDPVVKAVISCTPAENLLDWKLVFRDPLPTWVSPKGRICLLGDAAHPHLPTSIQGASQGVEDATTIATLLRLAGKHDIPTATRAYQEIRYDRTVMTQQLGVQVRNTWHRPRDWDSIDPESVKLPQTPELFAYDATEVAIERFPEAAAKVRAQYGGATAQEEVIEAAKESARAASAVMSVPILA